MSTEHPAFANRYGSTATGARPRLVWQAGGCGRMPPAGPQSWSGHHSAVNAGAAPDPLR